MKSGELEPPEFLELQNRESEALQAFFGSGIEVPALPKEITTERYEKWKENGFELHFLPSEDLTEDRELPGWKKKPGKRYTPGQQFGIEFFDEIKNGNLPPETTKLPGAWILIDERNKPSYQNGEQLYPNDEIIGQALAKLRKDGVIANFENKSSRFNISHDELRKPEVKEALAKVLDVPIESLRLPRAIERNYLGNSFYPEWGDTNTLEWYEDDYESGRKRLGGGYSEHGGLSGVGWRYPDDRNGDLGFRPFVVFSSK